MGMRPSNQEVEHALHVIGSALQPRRPDKPTFLEYGNGLVVRGGNGVMLNGGVKNVAERLLQIGRDNEGAVDKSSDEQ